MRQADEILIEKIKKLEVCFILLINQLRSEGANSKVLEAIEKIITSNNGFNKGK
jgi:hypothetical protein